MPDSICSSAGRPDRSQSSVKTQFPIAASTERMMRLEILAENSGQLSDPSNRHLVSFTVVSRKLHDTTEVEPSWRQPHTLRRITDRRAHRHDVRRPALRTVDRRFRKPPHPQHRGGTTKARRSSRCAVPRAALQVLRRCSCPARIICRWVSPSSIDKIDIRRYSPC